MLHCVLWLIAALEKSKQGLIFPFLGFFPSCLFSDLLLRKFFRMISSIFFLNLCQHSSIWIMFPRSCCLLSIYIFKFFCIWVMLSLMIIFLLLYTLLNFTWFFFSRFQNSNYANAGSIFSFMLFVCFPVFTSLFFYFYFLPLQYLVFLSGLPSKY